MSSILIQKPHNMSNLELQFLVEDLGKDLQKKYGGDYQIEELDEAKLVKSWGGAAYSIPYIEGFSSTSLIHRIRNFEN